MSAIIQDASVVTGEPGRTILYDSSLAIEEDRIVGIGPAAEIASFCSDAKIVDARGKAIFPGLINAHTHLLKTASRGIQEDLGFPTTLRFPHDTRGLLPGAAPAKPGYGREVWHRVYGPPERELR